MANYTVFTNIIRNSIPTVNMLRTNGSHFRLLWPKNAPLLPRGKKTTTSVKKRNIVENTVSKLKTLKISNKKAISRSVTIKKRHY